MCRQQALSARDKAAAGKLKLKMRNSCSIFDIYQDS
jgi:hypothetical protein